MTRRQAVEPLADAVSTLRSQYLGARLLLAEDKFINREVALELLHGVGLAVDAAEDGHQALAKAVARDHDLILTWCPGADSAAGWADQLEQTWNFTIDGGDRLA